MASRPHICFDRILPRELLRPLPTVATRGGRTRAISPIGKAWMNGSTLPVRFIGGSAAQQAKAREQAGWWQAVANLLRLRRRAERRHPHRLRCQRWRLVVHRHRLPQHPARTSRR